MVIVSFENDTHVCISHPTDGTSVRLNRRDVVEVIRKLEEFVTRMRQV